ENRSQRWVNAYDFPAVEGGDVIKREFSNVGPQVVQTFVFNMRLPRFQDRRVRKALTLAYNFEAQNRTISYNQFTRTDSYFEGTELAATGLPEGRELEILEPFRDQLPPEVFEEEFRLP